MSTNSPHLGIVSKRDLAFRLRTPIADIETIAAVAAKYYKPFFKKTRNKARKIDNPQDPLKALQTRIHKRLLSHIEPLSCVHGGVAGRSPITNVNNHLGKRVVIRIDIRRFFPSVSHHQVYDLWCKRLACSPDIARLLTKLTTYHGYLPQGAPTSTDLANLLLFEVDSQVLDLTGEKGFEYSRFVDDLVISGDNPRTILSDVVKIIDDAGFSIAHKKLRVMPRHRLQEVTGLSINKTDRPGIPRSWRAELRRDIHLLYSLDEHDKSFGERLSSIYGRIDHLGRTNQGAARYADKYLRKVLNDKRAIDSPFSP